MKAIKELEKELRKSIKLDEIAYEIAWKLEDCFESNPQLGRDSYDPNEETFYLLDFEYSLADVMYRLYFITRGPIPLRETRNPELIKKFGDKLLVDKLYYVLSMNAWKLYERLKAEGFYESDKKRKVISLK